MNTTTLFVGFAFASSMVADGAIVGFTDISVEQARDLLAGDYSSACNATHVATIQALKMRFGIEVTVPEVAPRVEMRAGDRLLLLQAVGLQRLGGDRAEYTIEEVMGAKFAFRLIELALAVTVPESISISATSLRRPVDGTVTIEVRAAFPYYEPATLAETIAAMQKVASQVSHIEAAIGGHHVTKHEWTHAEDGSSGVKLTVKVAEVSEALATGSLPYEEQVAQANAAYAAIEDVEAALRQVGVTTFDRLGSGSYQELVG